MDDKYLEGAYYYNHLYFAWGEDAIYADPSIYAIKEVDHIWLPYINGYMDVEKKDVIYIPFEFEGLPVRLYV